MLKSLRPNGGGGISSSNNNNNKKATRKEADEGMVSIIIRILDSLG